MEIGCEQPLEPGRIGPALQAQRFMLSRHRLGDLLIRGGLSGHLAHVTMVLRPGQPDPYFRQDPSLPHQERLERTRVTWRYRKGRAMQVFLETDRLVLRRFTVADTDNLVNLDADPDVMRFITGGIPTSREEIQNEFLPASWLLPAV